MHTLLDLRGPIPSFIHISDGKMGDALALDLITPEAGAGRPHLSAGRRRELVIGWRRRRFLRWTDGTPSETSMTCWASAGHR
jgi:hypothetical protein